MLRSGSWGWESWERQLKEQIIGRKPSELSKKVNVRCLELISFRDAATRRCGVEMLAVIQRF